MREVLRSLPGVGRVVDAIRRSYRRKLATALFVVLLVLGVAAAGLFVQTGALLRDDVEQSMTAAANAEADELTEWTSRNRLVTRVLSEDVVYQTGDRAAIREYLRSQRVTRTEAGILNAYVIDRRNQTVEISIRRDLEGTTVRELPWEQEFAFRTYDDVRSTRPYAGGTGTAAVGYITPIEQMPGHLLVVSIDAARVFDRFEHPVEGGFTRVVDSNGTVVFADDRSAALQQYHNESLRAPAVSRGLRGESGFIASPDYDRASSVEGEYVLAYAPVRGTDWVVLEHAPTSEAFAIVRQTRTWITVVALVAATALLGVVVVLGADVTRALSSLAARAERIEAGDYDVAFDTDRPDEFGDLNRTLAATRDTLRRRFTELTETKHALEASNDALEERSTMVSVLNRILRHNVRNDVNIIAGQAASLAESTDDERVRAELETIQSTAMELARISDQTRHIQQILSEANAELTPIQVADSLGPHLEHVRSEAPDATVELDVIGDTPPVALATATFPLAVADVVEQIVSHNDGSVTVSVTVTTEPAADGTGDGSVVLAIDDDGDGLPALDVQAVGYGEETPLKHAKGLALWCLEWSVNRADGELVVGLDDATVEIRLDRVGGSARLSEQ